MFGKGAKFSLYKPAEEMVYIGLDQESRTKGKAAIDVVGAQTGKSIGSILQQVDGVSVTAVNCKSSVQERISLPVVLQVLLVVSAGSLTYSLPVMGLAYWGILLAWLASVDKLAIHHKGAFTQGAL